MSSSSSYHSESGENETETASFLRVGQLYKVLDDQSNRIDSRLVHLFERQRDSRVKDKSHELRLA